MTKFPIHSFKGTPTEIGYSHGKVMRNQIDESIQYYTRVFDTPDDDLRQKADHFRKVITNFSPPLSQEIDAIAAGSGVEPYLIYALNARSELLNNYANECSVFYLQEPGLLAENWDWASIFEDLAFIQKIATSNYQLLTVTEPGILAKMGMNSKGIGVALNFLGVDEELLGLPIHVIIRYLLQQPDLGSISDVLHQFNGTAGHLLIAQADRGYISYEYAGMKSYQADYQMNPVHTNHFLVNNELNHPIEDYEGSISRKHTIETGILEVAHNLDLAKSILSDVTNRDFPVCRRYEQHEQIVDIGTVCSLIFDLKSLVLHYSPGNPLDHEYLITGLQ